MRPAASLLCVVLWAQAARAADPPPPAADAAALEEAKKRFAAGQALFEKGELKPAVEAFKEAYRLTRNPLLLYNIAYVYDQLDDAALALHYYSKFIDEAKDSERTRAQLTEASTRAAALRARLHIEPEPATPPADEPPPPPPPPPDALEHEAVDEAPPGLPIDITVRVPEAATWAVNLHYRVPGQDLYQAVKMRPRRGGDARERVARIPAAATRGDSVQYHVAARDAEGKLVASSGKSQTPHIVYLDPGAPPHHYLDPAEPPDRDPAAPPLPAGAAPRAAAPPDRPTRPVTYAKWAASGTAVALVGTGVGLVLAARSHADTLQGEAIASRNPELCGNDPPPCRPYSQQRKDLEARGRDYEYWGNVALVAGALVAAGAGALWYLDAREAARVTPVIGPGTLGAAAEVRF
jgi:hypothetical protein